MRDLSKFTDGFVYMLAMFGGLTDVSTSFNPECLDVEYSEEDGEWVDSDYFDRISYLEGVLEDGPCDLDGSYSVIDALQGYGFEFELDEDGEPILESSEWSYLYDKEYQAGFLYVKLSLAWKYFQILPLEELKNRGFDIVDEGDRERFMKEISEELEESWVALQSDYRLKVYNGQLWKKILESVAHYTSYITEDTTDEYIFV